MSLSWSWFPSYIAGNSSLIIGFVALIAALGAFAFFARDWRALVAALVVLAVGMGVQQIDKSAYERALSEQKARELAVLQKRIDQLAKINQADTERALADAAEIARLEALAGATPPNDRPCLPADASKRIDAIR